MTKVPLQNSCFLMQSIILNVIWLYLCRYRCFHDSGDLFYRDDPGSKHNRRKSDRSKKYASLACFNGDGGFGTPLENF